MRLVVIDPVVGGPVAREVAYASSVAASETQVRIESIAEGPRAIETHYDEAQAAPGILALLRRHDPTADAFVINCFADPALDAARECTCKPVAGAGEGAMLLALQLGHKFSVISVLANTAAWIERRTAQLGVSGRLASAVGLEISVLSLTEDERRTVDAIAEAANRAVRRDGAEVIVLGCTGMATLAAQVRELVRVPVVEPTSAAVKAAELMVLLGLAHCRGGLYLELSPDKLESGHRPASFDRTTGGDV